MKRIISVLIALAAVLSCMAFVSCGDGNKEAQMITVLADGESGFAIYRPDRGTKGETDGAGALRNLIMDVTGVRIQYSTDDEYGKIEGAKEIL